MGIMIDKKKLALALTDIVETAISDARNNPSWDAHLDRRIVSAHVTKALALFGATIAEAKPVPRSTEDRDPPVQKHMLEFAPDVMELLQKLSIKPNAIDEEDGRNG